MYNISNYSYLEAKKLGLQIKNSSNKKKKIDVYSKKDGKKICFIGDIKYLDFPSYLKIDKELANKKRKLYKIRHKKDINNKDGNGFYANKILW